MLAVPSARGQATLRYCLRAPFLASGEMDSPLLSASWPGGTPHPRGLYIHFLSLCRLSPLPHVACMLHSTAKA